VQGRPLVGEDLNPGHDILAVKQESIGSSLPLPRGGQFSREKTEQGHEVSS
jgi:hypothetical protein